MINNHPFRIRDVPSIVYWKAIPLKAVVDLEILIPFNSILKPYAELAYLQLCCIPSAPIGELCIAGEEVMVYFPLRTFINSWFSRPRQFRESITETDNIHLVFKKDSRESMEIITAERMQATPEHIAFANIQYTLLKEIGSTVPILTREDIEESERKYHDKRNPRKPTELRV